MNKTTRKIEAAVNILLDAEHDPVGVEAWWTQGNGWIGCPPRDLLGTDNESALLLLAYEVIA